MTTNIALGGQNHFRACFRSGDPLKHFTFNKNFAVYVYDPMDSSKNPGYPWVLIRPKSIFALIYLFIFCSYSNSPSSYNTVTFLVVVIF